MLRFVLTVLRGLSALILVTASAGVLIAAPAAAQGQVVNFNQAEIQAVIDDVSSVTGHTFIVDPSVRGRVTITSQTPLTANQYFQVFLSTMRVHGYTVVPTVSGAYQIVPDTTGARSPSPVNSNLRGDQYVTSVVRLSHIGVRDALTVLRPIIHPQGSINAAETANVLVIVDYAENMNRIQQVIRDLDRDMSVYEMVELENVSASEMTRIIQTIRTRNASGEDDIAFNVTVAPIPASNTIMLRGTRDAVTRMARLIREVDGVSESNQSFRVVYLSHADGETLLPILQQVVETLSEGEGEGILRQATISHHAPTNSLVINADPDIQRELELVIRQLDIRRPQVLVEGIIVEISDTTAAELGVQMLLAGGENSDSPLAITRFSSSNPDLLALTGAVTGTTGSTSSDSLRDTAINSLLGTRGAALGFGGQDSGGNLFGLILNAVDSDTDSNVLATPSIIAMDNEEASFLSGQEIPITTGEALGSNNSNPFRTVEREEVGIKLIVRPQITEGDTVRLYIEQEVSSIAGPINADSTDLITNKRSIQTTALADDGEIIVLGGLIEQDDQETIDAVPGLGNVPGIGRLFRSESRTSVRRNLMVFIRPTIIRDESDMQALSGSRYDYIAGQQRAASPTNTSSLEAIVDMLMTSGPSNGASDAR